VFRLLGYILETPPATPCACASAATRGFRQVPGVYVAPGKCNDAVPRMGKRPRSLIITYWDCAKQAPDRLGSTLYQHPQSSH